MRPLPAASSLPVARRLTISRALPPNKDEKRSNPPPSSAVNLEERLKRTGMNQKKAKEVLKEWEKLGVTNESELRKMLFQKSLIPASAITLQTALDSLAGFGSFYCGRAIGDADPFFAQGAIQFLFYFGASYYAFQVLIELTFIGTVIYTAYKYGTNSDQLLGAVKALAGSGSGISVVDKAALAVNTLKVLQILESISDLLKEDSKVVEGRSTLQNLSSYLTLSRAKDKYNFDPAMLGMGDKEAGDMAFEFSKFDTNDDERLELAELGNLCSSLGKDLSPEELKEALRLLDANNNSYIEFPEFANWCVF
ncbi:MAG: hypothetical protein WDW36_010167 [Sanguina aurantia]